MLIERTWKRWVYFYIPLTVFVVGTLFPFYWMLITAIRPDAELYRSWRAATNTPPWPLQPTPGHLPALVAKTTFPPRPGEPPFHPGASTGVSPLFGPPPGDAPAPAPVPLAGHP